MRTVQRYAQALGCRAVVRLEQGTPHQSGHLSYPFRERGTRDA